MSCVYIYIVQRHSNLKRGFLKKIKEKKVQREERGKEDGNERSW